jgi:hypothetical protein
LNDPTSQQKQGSQDKYQANVQQANGANQSNKPKNEQQTLAQWWSYPSWSDSSSQEIRWDSLSLNGRDGWIRGTGPQSELNLAAADESVRQHLNLPNGQGVVVLGVAPNSGAAQAGIEPNDILLMLGETPLGKPDDLNDGLKKAGEKEMPLALLRSGDRITIQIQPLIRVTVRPVFKSIRREYWIGVSVTAIEPVLRAQLQLPQNHGVIVNQVYPNSPAAKAGLGLHAIIVEVDENPITDPADLAKSVQAKGTKPLVLKIAVKGGKSRTITVTPERKNPNETSSASRDTVKSVVYDVVRPGVVLPSPTPLYNPYNSATGPEATYLSNVPLISDLYSKPQDGGSALNKRLDALDAEIKGLRKLVENLQKTAAKIVEQQEK